MKPVFWLFALSLAVAPAQNPPSGVTWPVKEADVVLRDFRFTAGGSLPQLRIHYRSLGEPRRDGNGVVQNAVLLLHGTSGSGAQFLNPVFANELFGPGQPLDVTRYFVIMPDGIGHGKSSKPSDGMRAEFPHYGYADMVEAERLTLEQLGVSHLRLLLGTSMGCMHAYIWTEAHPNWIDAAMPLACQPWPISGRNLAWRVIAMDAIRNDPEWKQGNYGKQPAALRTAAGIVALVSGNATTWQTAGPDRETALVNVKKTVDGRLGSIDANDFLYALDSSRDYNPAPELAKIRTPMHHINFADDTVNPPELHIAEDLLKHASTVTFELYPYTKETVGHSSHTKAVLWKDRLARLLETTGRP